MNPPAVNTEVTVGRIDSQNSTDHVYTHHVIRTHASITEDLISLQIHTNIPLRIWCVYQNLATIPQSGFRGSDRTVMGG
jgi:hypothetical protein